MFKKNKLFITALVGFLLALVGFSYFVPNSWFIAHADFRFPLDASTYLNQHKYIWNELNGSVGIDNNIRIFSRGIFVLFFLLFNNNVIFSYFFIVLNLVIIFTISYLFLCKYIQLNNKYSLLLSAYFIFNPVFLGNFSKLGLVFATSLLLPIIYTIKKYYLHNKLIYLLIASILINFSFVHPFTFIVNLIAALFCFTYYFIFNKKAFRTVIYHLIFTIIFSLVLNLYYLFPIFNYSLFEKSAISNSTGTSGDASFLFDIANTQSFLEAFTLSKGVFVEYEFYSEYTKIFYYSGYILIHILLIVGLLQVKKFFKPRDKKLVIVAMSSLLVLSLLTRGGGVSFVRDFYVYLENIPGGWAFRSPLKWQLYQPISIILIWAVILNFRDKLARKFRYCLDAGLIIMFLMSSTLFGEVYLKLLIPNRYPEDIKQLNFRNSSVAFENDAACKIQVDTHRDYFDDLKHKIFNEARIFKTLNEDDLYENSIYYANFDYIIACNQYSNVFGDRNYSFFYSSTSPDYYILKNTTSQNEVYTLPKIVKSDRILSQQNFEHFTPDSFVLTNTLESVNYADLFGYLKDYQRYDYSIISSLKNIEILYDFNPDTKELKLYYAHIGNLYIDNVLFFENEKEQIYSTYIPDTTLGIFVDNEYFPFFAGENSLGNFTPQNTVISFMGYNGIEEYELNLPQYALKNKSVESGVALLGANEKDNSFENSSFESGSWQEEVGDCFNYDDNPDIDMNIRNDVSTLGEKSLELSARRHVACVSQKILIKPNKIFNFSVDTVSKAGVFDLVVVFEGSLQPRFQERFFVDGSQTISTSFALPNDATEATVYLQVPQQNLRDRNTVIFDNVQGFSDRQLTQTYVYDNTLNQAPSESKIIDITKQSPTYYTFSVRAKGSFPLVLKQSFNTYWFLFHSGYEVGEHFTANYLYNGWNVDIESLCYINPDECVYHSDGTISTDFIIEYLPQRYYYRTVMISSFAFVGALIYISWYFFDTKRKKSTLVADPL